ncbi:L,D-transpeptidase scaffold domain-containing protein [Pedobacter metabolipauper]|uniref:L,D-transpeptidase-like protein n=1 Tax=Pedobacter metabolipauper TaxID=425513 RepID=A0A4R6SXF2_9SPHI|nr:L,D-transpeptidase family protein [Pedobacter metabolipauper]TDQ10129.1 L,D-transpeptidase-like protein [Pedobacter metabolipauper]
MHKSNRSKTTLIFLLAIASLSIILPACKKKVRSDISKVLFSETRNKVFKDLNADTFAVIMKRTLEQGKSKMTNPKLITSFYESKDYEPILILQHLPKGQLKNIPEYLSKTGEHGLDPRIFSAEQISTLTGKFYDKKAIKTKEEAYQDLADLELMLANSFINYSNAMQFGILSPRKIYANYYTKTKRPDSISMIRIFAVKDLKNYLDSIQPKMPQYLALQKALSEGVVGPQIDKEETSRILKANLERLRWKNKPSEKKYVLVNIADFSLDVIDNNKSVLTMKVCVGEGRNKDLTADLKEYDETGLSKDRPFSRETPQLNSMIHSVQVNPVWNIPESIATNEITKDAAKDRFYLSNKNIDVYKDGKIVEDPETIDFSAADAGKIYTFKQRPGDDNSLGKIKFLFQNDESVYLHDTPAKAAFNLPMRAVSHGCVRVEKPLDLALALFGEGTKYQTIKKEMQSDKPEAKDIVLSPQVAVYLTYITAWTDGQNVLHFRKDVYGLDIVLDSYLQRLSAGK